MFPLLDFLTSYRETFSICSLNGWSDDMNEIGEDIGVDDDGEKIQKVEVFKMLLSSHKKYTQKSSYPEPQFINV
jgi:hypothetical protein